LDIFRFDSLIQVRLLRLAAAGIAGWATLVSRSSQNALRVVAADWFHSALDEEAKGTQEFGLSWCGHWSAAVLLSRS
jgi:hypothetical protein